MRLVNVGTVLTATLFLATAAERHKVPPAAWILNNSAQGREFWIAIPPNEVDGYPGQLLEIYVTSSYNTEVTLFSAMDGRVIRKPVRAMDITTFSLLNGELFWTDEVRESEVVTQKGIRLSAPHPISVYVLSGKPATSDGYLALPVNVWGTEYMHLSYYDYEDFGQKRGNGFVIIASEDQTLVQIQLYGKGYGRSVGGRRIGDRITVMLNRGQTYMLRGSGDAPPGQNDFSGSRIYSNKPVGFISFHMRTMIPTIPQAGAISRDFLVEMLPPISAWGKRYITIEYQRRARKGDFFRILASQPNTNFTVRWYRNNQLRGSISGRLQNAGDFWEYNYTIAADDSSIYGQSIWEADKPVLLMQYSYSAFWDNDPNFDPFMIVVTPVEQYIRATVFQTPASKAFATNYFNLIAIGDTNDPTQAKLKSIKVDGQHVWRRHPEFLGQRIPGTNLYWVVLRMQPGPHRIVGETPFGGYIYGFSQYDSYGWPAAMAINKIDELDTLPPELHKRVDCGDWEILSTEIRNGKEGDNPRQIDQGIAQIELLEGSYNYRLRFVTAEELKPYPKVERFVFRVEVIDKRHSAFARIGIIDRAGNIAIDSVWHIADSLVARPEEPIEASAVRLGRSQPLTVTLQNARDSAAVIKEARLVLGTAFRIVAGAVPPERRLNGRETHVFQLEYRPTREHGPNEYDWDTLVVRTECAEFRWALRGRGIMPHIWVEDWDAGTIPVNTTVCNTGGLLVRNPGTDTLHISNIQGVQPPFTLNQISPPLPIRIPPGGQVRLTMACYSPTVVGSDAIDVTFVCDAPPGDKNISHWRGRAVKAGPYITSYDWGERRVGSVQEAYLYVRNAGNTAAYLKEIRPRGLAPAGNFRILSVEPQPSPGNPVEVKPNEQSEVRILVRYTPQAEGLHLDSVDALFANAESVTGYIRGIGILPQLEAHGYTFRCILLGESAEEPAAVVLRNPSTSADLTINAIRWAAGSAPDFTWLQPLPTFPYRLPKGGELRLGVRFAPQAVGERRGVVEIVSDAAPAPDSIVTTRVEILGSGCINTIAAEGLDFGRVLTCDQPEGFFPIINPNPAGDISIQGLELIAGDIDAFKLLEPTAFPVSIPAGDTLQVRVRFMPTDPRSYEATVAIRNSINPDLRVTLRGTGYRAATAYALEPARMLTAPGEPIQLSIVGRSNAWSQAALRRLQGELLYNSTLMQYIPGSAELGSALDATWQLQVQELPGSGSTARLLLTAAGQNPIARDGELLRVRFQTYLGNALRIEPELSISLPGREQCVDVSTTPNTIELGGCFLNGRIVRLSPEGYLLRPIQPNPVREGVLQVDYSIGLEAPTQVEILNSMGERVLTLVSGTLPAGRYQHTVDVHYLPAGAYWLRLVSGPFTAVERFLIVR
ncbi:MAG: choice-of-anchor D domain-containing protein [Candidatus Kapabacteria bacterium]|nr:choice-of-anchor D domain-containing protein [Candidatus Kapabacteria bacterium]MDW8012814.1 choice-of-anchor D domain-containing protein [Bacteroidota bacterium]